MDEADALLLDQGTVPVARVDDHHARPVKLEMPLDQGKGSLADRAEADHDDGAVDPGVDGPLGHRVLLGLRNRGGFAGS